MVKAPCFNKDGIKKGAWSEDEDNRLRLYIQKNGHTNWRELPKLAGLSRCGKSCRLRWLNYLRPNLRRGKFTKEEEDVILKLHKKLGSKWSVMAAQLPGRSDNDIKNHWHTHLKNRKNELQSRILESSKDIDKPKGCRLVKKSNFETQQEVGILLKVLSSGLPSSSSSTSEGSQLWVSDAKVTDEFLDSYQSFWTEPFLLDIDDVMLSSDNMFSPMFF